MIKKHLSIIYSIYLKLKDWILELVFPYFCVGCGKDDDAKDWLCHQCTDKIVKVISQVCPECGRLSLYGRFCDKCRYEEFKENVPNKKKSKIFKRRKPLEGVLAAAYYEEGPIREMVHNLKYNSVTELAPALARMMTETLSSNFQISNILSLRQTPKKRIENLKNDNYLKIDTGKLIISYVPLHWRRLARRGYNQSELLAKEVAKELNLPVYCLLKKFRSTKRQVEMTGKKRRENLQKVFQVKSYKVNQVIRNKTIIIVDDVVTTGSTLNECARVLKSAGAKEVWGLVIARG